MITVSLSKNDVHNGSLILVNRDCPVYAEHCGNRLMPVGDNGKVLIEKSAANVLKKLMRDMNLGEKIIATSGYRSKEKQTKLYENSLTDNGLEFTAKYVALPDHSEHQTGLAVDLALKQRDIDDIRPYFPYTGDCGAFREKATVAGFIERYPEGKEKITGIAHEPWHFRYVGAPHAKIMHEMSVTLEEYHLLMKEFPYGEKPFKFDFDGSTVSISYLAAGSEQTVFETESDVPFSVSGDNMNGYIITKWVG
ncbi:MAG: D-alanyl-D-alanine carboxypeptidase family protein [Defluviitaleaceae bacterium]|nr:D-alanyl-D-alanine carboxypeptidase family protein [Defluviitaleaceae bacterium]MCL2835620.1 D-alanyl-D-alanine carboxypeptidase family protein [Defluviitaleaceae bacterium]